jgi:hypothetical protein
MQLKTKSKSGKMLSILSRLVIAIILLVGCKKASKPLSKEEMTTLPNDFVQFYEKFHTDSAYQMAHIQFPLDGYPAQADSALVASGTFKWQKETWRMHRLEAFSDSLFTRTFEIPMDGFVTEKIKQKDMPYGLYRRFYRRGNNWVLIFYSDLNGIKPE